jgi:hypothetical protein
MKITTFKDPSILWLLVLKLIIESCWNNVNLPNFIPWKIQGYINERQQGREGGGRGQSP